MSVDKLVDSTLLDADLTSVANAIRTKGGTSAQLSFPADFVSAIAAIATGFDYDDISNHDYPAGAVTIPATRVFPWSYARSPFTSVNLPNCTSFTDAPDGVSTRTGAYAFAYCDDLVSVNLPEYSYVGTGGYQFAYCPSLIDVYMPKGYTGQHMFHGCTSLVNIAFGDGRTSTVSMNGQAFYGCTALKKVDLGKGISRITSGEFDGCSVLDTLVLRRSDSITTLYNINAFTGTPFASGGSGGTIYVPSALKSTYQSATNWSTINGYGTVTWQNLEGSPYENYYVDGRAKE